MTAHPPPTKWTSSTLSPSRTSVASSTARVEDLAVVLDDDEPRVQAERREQTAQRHARRDLRASPFT
jgi:hypothetical protein